MMVIGIFCVFMSMTLFMVRERYIGLVSTICLGITVFLTSSVGIEFLPVEVQELLNDRKILALTMSILFISSIVKTSFTQKISPDRFLPAMIPFIYLVNDYLVVSTVLLFMMLKTMENEKTKKYGSLIVLFVGMSQQYLVGLGSHMLMVCAALYIIGLFLLIKESENRYESILIYIILMLINPSRSEISNLIFSNLSVSFVILAIGTTLLLKASPIRSSLFVISSLIALKMSTSVGMIYIFLLISQLKIGIPEELNQKRKEILYPRLVHIVSVMALMIIPIILLKNISLNVSLLIAGLVVVTVSLTITNSDLFKGKSNVFQEVIGFASIAFSLYMSWVV